MSHITKSNNELMRWMPPPSGIEYTKTVLYSPSGGRINDIEDQHFSDRLSKRQLSGLCGRIRWDGSV